jgi:hypothetical protein
MFVLSPGPTGTGQTKGTEMNANLTVANLTPKTTYRFELTDGTTFDAMYTSTTSKGLTLKVGDKVITRSLNKVAAVFDIDTPNTPADLFTDEGTYGAADIAAALEMTAYDLRVALRLAGYWVGKGHKYGFDMSDANQAVRAVRNVLATPVAE